MKISHIILLALLVCPVGVGAAGRFELRSDFTPSPEPNGTRFAMRSHIQAGTAPARRARETRFGIAAVLPGPCTDVIFLDGFE